MMQQAPKTVCSLLEPAFPIYLLLHQRQLPAMPATATIDTIIIGGSDHHR